MIKKKKTFQKVGIGGTYLSSIIEKKKKISTSRRDEA